MRLDSRVSILLLWISAGTFTALHSPPAWGQWQVFRTDVLPDNVVYSIHQTRCGDFWFGTGSGAAWSNGIEWQQHQRGTVVNWVLEDSNGDLWLATFGNGAMRYDGLQWTVELEGMSVNTIVEDSSKRLWFGTYDSGVAALDASGQWEPFTEFPGNTVMAVYEDRTKALWFGTENGVVRLMDENFEWVGLPGDSVRAIVEDDSGSLWFGTNHGIKRFSPAGLDTFYGHLVFTSVARDRLGRLWFGNLGGPCGSNVPRPQNGTLEPSPSHISGAESGSRHARVDCASMIRFDGVRWTTYQPDPDLFSPGNPPVHSVLVDDDQNVWFGTSSGLTRCGGERWESFTRSGGFLPNNTVHVMMEDRRAALWFGTDSGVAVLQQGTWSPFAIEGIPAASPVRAVAQDSSGTYWFGTDQGVTRWDGADAWETYTTLSTHDSLVSNDVRSIAAEGSNGIWVATSDGASFYDGHRWLPVRRNPSGNGLVSNIVRAIVVDNDDAVWFATDRGVSRLQRDSEWKWDTFRSRLSGGPLMSDDVRAILLDRDSGDLWFATGMGVHSYDAGADLWTADSLVGDQRWLEVQALAQDPSGIIWAGSESKPRLARHDSEGWHDASADRELSFVDGLMVDRSGNVWLALRYDGATVYEPDRGAPHVVLTETPDRLTSDRTPRFAFQSAFRNVQGIEFSYWLDDSISATPWDVKNVYTVETDLPDGHYSFHVRARDPAGNVSRSTAAWDFEIDATPPQPVIAFPTYGGAVRETVDIRGSAADTLFVDYTLEVRRSGSNWDEAKQLVHRTTPVVDSVLGRWNTQAAEFEDGIYDLRLSVRDVLGLVGTAIVSVMVDNEPPWAEQTSPARVSALRGGDVYTTQGELHLYFPPRAFTRDALVEAHPSTDTGVDDPWGRSSQAMAAFDVEWGGVPLGKPAILELAIPAAQDDASPSAATLYHRSGSTWRRIGGSIDTGSARITAPVQEEGCYALFEGDDSSSNQATLSALSLTPRAFSPSGRFASSQIAIAFELGQGASVTVRVYNAAGRLVRQVAAGQPMAPGANVVRWDGRDREGRIASPGIYLVSVDALGKRQTATLAVAR